MKYRSVGVGLIPEVVRGAAWIAFFLILVGWQTGSSSGVLSGLILPSPAEILLALWALINSGDLWRHLSASLSRILIGWSLGALAGLCIGFSIGMFTLFRSIGLSLVSALFPIPKIALLPLFNHLVRHRRAFKDRHHLLWRIFPHSDQYIQRCGQRQPQPDSDGTNLSDFPRRR